MLQDLEKQEWPLIPSPRQIMEMTAAFALACTDFTCNTTKDFIHTTCVFSQSIERQCCLECWQPHDKFINQKHIKVEEKGEHVISVSSTLSKHVNDNR